MEKKGDARGRWEERYAKPAKAVDAPSAYLVAHADQIHGRVLDAAGGAGRHALYLARRGLNVDLIDIAFGGLQRALSVAQLEKLRVRAVQADLEEFPLPSALYDAVVNIRYLQRSLFESLRRTLKPGGMILFETFLIDQQKIGHIHNPAFLLQPGELRSAFAAFEILDYTEGLVDADEPAYLARMLARRPLKRWD
jgi:SAM-dependent methyltransferase